MKAVLRLYPREHFACLVYRDHREEYTRVEDALVREKQLKGWRRSKKVALIEFANPEWMDLGTA